MSRAIDPSKAGKALGKGSASKAGKASWAGLTPDERSKRASENRRKGWDRIKVAKEGGSK